MAHVPAESTSGVSLRMPRFRLLTLLAVVLLLGGLIGGIGMRWQAAQRDRESIALLRGLWMFVGCGHPDDYNGDEWDQRFNPKQGGLLPPYQFIAPNFFNKVEYVSVSKDTLLTSIDDRVLQTICRLSSLRHLNLKGVPNSQLKLYRLSKLTHLETIALDDTDTTDDQVAALGQQKELKCLRLSGTPITDQSMTVVASFPKLASLDISRTAITDEGLKRLEKCDHLEILWASGTQTTSAGLDQLRAALPNCEVVYH